MISMNMTDKIYNRNNFHKHTFCVFTEVEMSEMKDYTIGYQSKSGSSYYFTDLGVYRVSNHWGRAANCKWRLENKFQSSSRTKAGFALWTSFHSDNDSEKLYFIAVDYATEKVYYEHKNSASFSGNVLLRTASETTRTIKQIRNLFDNDAWANHFETEDSNALRKEIIQKMITTNETLSAIKSAIRNAL